ncbi:MAG: hypothetical protein M0P71_02585 [Melioribacteraceae bacterium]|nr:hypothetical protein [Melioribacteraceae bacterium]
MNHVNKRFFLLIPLLFLFVQCKAQTKLSNPDHLNHLYEEIKVDGKEMGITHIYCDYPEYKWTGDDDEGVACVDDVARATLYYLRTGDLERAKKQIEFILHMQNETGWFYNFVWDDNEINKTHQNSVAEANWWTWRALVSLIEGYPYFKEIDKLFSERILSSITKTIIAMKKEFKYEKETTDLNGFKRPTWLPHKFAADQSALIITALSEYYSIVPDEFALRVINDFAEGIVLMQEGDEKTFPYYAFMSWENQWHAWGNTQSFSLLKAYEITKNKKYLDSALKEIDNFYPFLLKRGFLNEFSIMKNNGEILLKDEKQYSQIAYGINSMVMGTLEAAKITDDKKYSHLAAAIATWFFCNNSAKAQMYFPETGMGYDGISGINEVNKNSGAESTIEALLAIHAIENDEIANKALHDLIKNYGDVYGN